MRRADAAGNAFLLAPTTLGGGLGFSQPLPETMPIGHGGIIGFVKCLGMEWPEVLVRAVDFNASCSVVELREHLLAELRDEEGPLEVGYLGRRRVTWQPVAAPLDVDPDAPPVVAKGSTILLTGGARGITAAIACELAQRYQPNLVLVGRSKLPEGPEPAETASLTTPAEIKAALIARARVADRQPAPAEIEAAYRRLLQDREMRATVDRIRRAGADVLYYSVDVRDERAMGQLVEDVTQRFGAIDGVIHGAGVIDDKLVKDKTPSSFDRVFGTKVESAAILSRILPPANLKFCVFFASIASRYGNVGQADYAAANEVLSKLAADLDRRWPARVFSIAWGPWSHVGMVADLEKHLAARGVALIPPEVGSAFLIDELNHRREGESEVLIAGGAENVVQPNQSGKSTQPDVAARSSR
jgi:NAD(P)-dependent dehydrogenase (short-subunit alcohol dehydrogenase family)